MSDAATVSALAKSTARKAKTPRKSKPTCAHPSYKDMIIAAIIALRESVGSSRKAIMQYIQANYKVGENTRAQVKATLKNGVSDGTFKQAKVTDAVGSLCMEEKKKSTPRKKPAAKKPTAKSPTVKKSPKKVAKKPASKKPTAKKSATKQSTAKKDTSAVRPATRQATRESAARSPVTKQTATKRQLAAKKPAAKKSTTKKPAARRTAKV